jgi:NADH:ubiquinone reductase (non-electrogenic)
MPVSVPRSKVYPNLYKEAEIRIIELMDYVLSTYDRAIGVYTAEQFKRVGVKLVLNSRVASVADGVVKVGGRMGTHSLRCSG